MKTPEVKMKYQQTEAFRLSVKKYRKSTKGRATRRRYEATKRRKAMRVIENRKYREKVKEAKWWDKFCSPELFPRKKRKYQRRKDVRNALFSAGLQGQEETPGCPNRYRFKASRN